jgi:hypothetical protein
MFQDFANYINNTFWVKRVHRNLDLWHELSKRDAEEEAAGIACTSTVKHENGKISIHVDQELDLSSEDSDGSETSEDDEHDKEIKETNEKAEKEQNKSSRTSTSTSPVPPSLGSKRPSNPKSTSNTPGPTVSSIFARVRSLSLGGAHNAHEEEQLDIEEEMKVNVILEDAREEHFEV